MPTDDTLNAILEKEKKEKESEIIPISYLPEEILGKVNCPIDNIAEHGYFMTYRHGMSPFNFKGFKHRGDLKSARNRAFKHGEIMGYKNIWVFPQFENLEEIEKNKVYSGEVKTVIPPERQ